MYSVPGRTGCRIYFGWYNASPKPTSEFFNTRTLTSIVGHAALLTKGSNERLSSSVVFRHLSVYYSITSTWNYKDSAARGDMNNNRACSPHQLSDTNAHALPPSTCCFASSTCCFASQTAHDQVVSASLVLV